LRGQMIHANWVSVTSGLEIKLLTSAREKLMRLAAEGRALPPSALAGAMAISTLRPARVTASNLTILVGCLADGLHPRMRAHTHAHRMHLRHLYHELSIFQGCDFPAAGVSLGRRQAEAALLHLIMAAARRCASSV
jgi:hypothetical protein